MESIFMAKQSPKGQLRNKQFIKIISKAGSGRIRGLYYVGI